MLSRRPVRLHAVSRDFTSSYSLEREHVLACASERPSDFQYLHEIKTKIDHARCWEALKASALENSKQHYCLSRLGSIRKHKTALKTGS